MTKKNLALCLAATLVFGSIAKFAPSARAGNPAQPAPIVIPLGEPEVPEAPQALTASPSPYTCTLPQDDIRQRVLMALSFTQQGSYGKAQHALQLLLEDLSTH